MSDENETDKLAAEIEEYTKKINKINSMIAKIKARINILEE
jgi:hypothetical protein